MTELVGVVDIGSSCMKLGFSGEDIPSSIFPSVITKLTKYQPYIESNPEIAHSNHSDFAPSHNDSSAHPIIRGVVRDWEKVSKLWESVTNELGTDSVDTTSILLVESAKTTKKDRSRWAEILFEAHHAPSMCFLNSSSASIFASGRTSGLSIDCGAGITSTVPVYEGLQLKHAALTSDFGGQDITHHLQQLLASKHINLPFSDVRYIKESKANLTALNPDSPNSNGSKMTTLTLPDGTEVEVDDSLFSECTNNIFYDDKQHYKGIINQTCESIDLCDESLKRLLYSNIVLSGGTTQITGFGDKVKWELQDKLSVNFAETGNFGVNVVPNSVSREAGYTNQSKYAAWIGGSIIGSMDTYKDIKITRQEWEENADSIVETKCY